MRSSIIAKQQWSLCSTTANLATYGSTGGNSCVVQRAC